MNASRRFGIPALFLLLFAAGAFASGSGSKSQTPESKSQTPEASTDPAIQLYEEGLKKVEAKDWKGALSLFERAHQAKKKDPDILNMLAFTQRKNGQLDDAFTNYAKVLEMKPEFPQAREYLAEAHLQAAMEQMKILRDYGSEAQAEVTMLLDAFAKAAWTVGARPAAGDSTRRW
jgi:outer membrane protein assembly factor BamD (BamD/ComL family)